MLVIHKLSIKEKSMERTSGNIPYTGNKLDADNKLVQVDSCDFNLPEELVVKIFSYLTAPQLSLASGVCKTWNRISGESWKDLFQLKFPFSSREHIEKWKVAYIDHLLNLKSFGQLELKKTSSISVAFSSLGDKIIMGLMNGKVAVGNLQNGKISKSYLSLRSRPLTGLTSVAVNPTDDKKLVVGTMDGDAYYKTEKTLTRLEGHKEAINATVFNSTGSLVATASTDHAVKLWSSGELCATLDGHQHAVFSAAFHPTKSILATGDSNGNIIIWNLGKDSLPTSSEEKTSIITSIAAHDMTVYSLSFSSDGRFLVSGSADGKALVFQTDNLSSPPIILQGHSDSIYSVAVSPNNKYAATGSKDKTVKIWNIEEKLPLLTLKKEKEINSVAFSQDGTRIAIGMEGGCSVELLPSID